MSVPDSVSDQMWNMNTLSTSVPHLWCCITTRKVFLKNIMIPKLNWPLTFWIINVISLPFFPTFEWDFIIISIWIFELRSQWPINLSTPIWEGSTGNSLKREGTLKIWFTDGWINLLSVTIYRRQALINQINKPMTNGATWQFKLLLTSVRRTVKTSFASRKAFSVFLCSSFIEEIFSSCGRTDAIAASTLTTSIATIVQISSVDASRSWNHTCHCPWTLLRRCWLAHNTLGAFSNP